MDILFWNCEGGSSQHQRILAGKVNIANLAAERATRGKRGREDPPITRASLAERARGRKLGIGGITGGDREKDDLSYAMRAEQNARQSKKKSEVMDYLYNGGGGFNHRFFCEVVNTFPNKIDPSWQSNAGIMAKFYAYSGAALAPAFANISIGLALPVGWPVAIKRVPKSTLGLGGIVGVNFAFWHAPSGGSGVEVDFMMNYLNAQGGLWVLFGDLNCNPLALNCPQGWRAEIPNGDTRISGRILDFAVTNHVNVSVRKLWAYSGYEIKKQVGSDHMPMVLSVT